MKQPHQKSAAQPHPKQPGKGNNPARVLQEMAKENQSTDVLGSYTGTPADGGQPVQDADDL